LLVPSLSHRNISPLTAIPKTTQAITFIHCGKYKLSELNVNFIVLTLQDSNQSEVLVPTSELKSTVAHKYHGKTFFSTAKLTFSRQNFLSHGKTYFSTAKLTFPRHNFLFHGETFFSTAELSF